MSEKFAGVSIDESAGTLSYKGQTWPLGGVKASVDTEGQIRERATLTRAVATFGLGLFMFKKKKDERKLYFTVEGPGVAIVEQCDPDKGQKAREFAARVNSLAQRATE